MPGINETGKETQRDQSEAPENGSLQVNGDESSAGADEEQPRELSLTDRLNKILLNSFLERINQQTTSENAQNGGDNDSADNDNAWE